MLAGAPNLALIGLRGTNATVFEDTFYGTTSIQILDLSSNFMLMIPTRLLENQTSLHTIDFANNRLWNFENIQDVFGNQSRSIAINLQMNSFKVIDFEFMKRFNSFQFSGNSIGTIPENAFSPELIELSLNAMELRSIHENAFVGLNQLRRLTIESNPLESLGRNIFHPLITLETLSFTGNTLSHFHPEMFVHNTNLIMLNLASNGKMELGENMFTSSLMNLDTLTISSNQIYRLNSNSFGTLRNLTRLVVSHNRISEIEPGFFRNFPNLQTFDASSNECISSNLVNVDFDNFEGLNMCRVNWSNRNGTTTTPSGQVKLSVFNAVLVASLASLFFL
jgi:Leucine-rich repeat (LRR) protein